jgi:hypothetical protein
LLDAGHYWMIRNNFLLIDSCLTLGPSPPSIFFLN